MTNTEHDPRIKWCRENLRGFADMHDVTMRIRAEEAQNRREMLGVDSFVGASTSFYIDMLGAEDVYLKMDASGIKP